MFEIELGSQVRAKQDNGESSADGNDYEQLNDEVKQIVDQKVLEGVQDQLISSTQPFQNTIELLQKQIQDAQNELQQESFNHALQIQEIESQIAQAKLKFEKKSEVEFKSQILTFKEDFNTQQQILQSNIDDFQNQINNLAESENKAQEEKQLQEEMNSYQEQLDKIQENYEKQIQELEDSLNLERQQLNDFILNLQQHSFEIDGDLTYKIDEINNKIKSLEDQISQLSEQEEVAMQISDITYETTDNLDEEEESGETNVSNSDEKSSVDINIGEVNSQSSTSVEQNSSLIQEQQKKIETATSNKLSEKTSSSKRESKTENLKSSNLRKSNQINEIQIADKQAGGVEYTGSLVTQCTGALMSILAPEFCWNTLTHTPLCDEGYLNDQVGNCYKCPDDRYKYGAFCYKNCDPGYYSEGTICTKGCAQGDNFALAGCCHNRDQYVMKLKGFTLNVDYCQDEFNCFCFVKCRMKGWKLKCSTYCEKCKTPPYPCKVTSKCNGVQIGLLCYENCEDDYHQDGFYCAENCEDNYTWIGALGIGQCCKALQWYENSIGLTSIYSTSYKKKAYCSSGFKLIGLTCVRMDFPKNCENYDYFPPMVNCGLACAANNQACGASIGDMAANTLFGIAQLALLIVSLGTSSTATGGFTAAKSSFSTAISKSGVQQAMKQAFIRTKELLMKEKDEVLNILKKQMAKIVVFGVSDSLISNACSAVIDTYVSKSAPSFDPASLDLTGITSAIIECQTANEQPSNLYAQADCQRAIMSMIGSFDPTGLVSLAASFIHATCVDP